MSSRDVSKPELPFDQDPGDGQVLRSGNERILIAEDDPDIGQDLKERLEGLEYNVLEITPLANEAIALAGRLKPDLVLMDIQLSGQMDGIEAAEHIRQLHIPVVFVTGYCDGAIIERAQLTEPCGYILKPYTTSDIAVAVQMGLWRHRAELARGRLLDRLQQMVSNLKTLTGQLSVCCYCKKIKDEKGDWPELEAYIMAHSNATFTHGICPHCFESVKRKIEALEKADAAGPSLVLG
jgi:two-component system, response regulator PdtaR